MDLELIDNDYLLRIDGEEFEITGFEETEEGYIYVDGVASYVGVMKYLNEDGSPRNEYVPAATLKKYGRNLLHKPVTLEHPPTSNGLLDSTTVAKYQVGEVVSVNFDEDTEELKVRLLVKDKTAVDEVKSRKTIGLSPGYRVKRKPARPGAAWDYEQAERQHNHCALVRNPRAGDGASLRLDSEGNVIIDTQTSQEDALEDKDENKDGLTAAIDAMKSSLDEMKSEMDEMKAEMKDMYGEEKKEKEEKDSAPKPNADSLNPAELIEAVDAARKFDVEFDAQKDSVADIQRKVVLAQLGEDVQVDAADVRGAFKLLVAQATKADADAKKDEADDSLNGISGNFNFDTSDRGRQSGLDNLGANNDSGDMPEPFDFNKLQRDATKEAR